MAAAVAAAAAAAVTAVTVVRAWTAPSRHRVEKAVAVQAAEGDTVTTLIASRVAVRLLW